MGQDLLNRYQQDYFFGIINKNAYHILEPYMDDQSYEIIHSFIEFMPFGEEIEYSDSSLAKLWDHINLQ